MRDFVESRVDLDPNYTGAFPPRLYGRSNEDVGNLNNVDDCRNGFLAGNRDLYEAAMWAIMKVCIFRSHHDVAVHT